jgi:hypothetical protein
MVCCPAGGKMSKALHVCRQLHAAGWRVVLVETYKYWHVGARLSTSVDVFARVPVPELYPDEYKQAIAGEWVCGCVRRRPLLLLPPATYMNWHAMLSTRVCCTAGNVHKNAHW